MHTGGEGESYVFKNPHSFCDIGFTQLRGPLCVKDGLTQMACEQKKQTQGGHRLAEKNILRCKKEVTLSYCSHFCR